MSLYPWLPSNIRDAVGKEFATIYFDANPFGSMLKTDVDLLLFHLLRKHGAFAGDSQFTICKKLRISEAKVKKLLYESELRFGEFDEEKQYTEQLRAIIEKAQISKDGNKIQFAVEDPFLRQLLSAKLKERNTFCDTSYNREIISVSPETFTQLLEIFFWDKDATQLMAFATTKLGKQSKTDLIIDIIKGGIGMAGGIVCKNPFAIISSAIELVKLLKQLLKQNNE